MIIINAMTQEKMLGELLTFTQQQKITQDTSTLEITNYLSETSVEELINNLLTKSNPSPESAWWD